jgi:hypothetical protein
VGEEKESPAVALGQGLSGSITATTIIDTTYRTRP